MLCIHIARTQTCRYRCLDMYTRVYHAHMYNTIHQGQSHIPFRNFVFQRSHDDLSWLIIDTHLDKLTAAITSLQPEMNFLVPWTSFVMAAPFMVDIKQLNHLGGVHVFMPRGRQGVIAGRWGASILSLSRSLAKSMALCSSWRWNGARLINVGFAWDGLIHENPVVKLLLNQASNRLL